MEAPRHSDTEIRSPPCTNDLIFKLCVEFALALKVQENIMRKLTCSEDPNILRHVSSANPYLASVVDYGLYSLIVKEGPECLMIDPIVIGVHIDLQVDPFLAYHIPFPNINPIHNDHHRWTLKHPEVSEYIGTGPNVDRFDSQFFMVHNRLAENMPPMARIVLEQSYQAIYDAGLSPRHLSGKKVGVYTAFSFSETDAKGMNDTSQISGYNIVGCSKSMISNRVSYWLNVKGPSISLDGSSSGSTLALEEAFRALNSGIIEAAVVAGTNLCPDPEYMVHYHRCFKISSDGKTRCFDQNANGCAKSDAICVLFLQKAKYALRAYAELVDVTNQFMPVNTEENGQIFGFIRDPDFTAKFLKNFYSNIQVSPQEIEYVEACSVATPETDKAELESIEKVFCDNRTNPLLVGSVVSNIGFTDAATGLTAVTKVLLAFNRGVIASNINCETPRNDIAALQDGRMRIVTEHQPFHGTYAAVNNMSYTGLNAHILLRGCSKHKDSSRYTTTIPRLVTVSARQKDYLTYIFQDLKARPVDPEQIALLQNIHSKNISGHLGRGYIILATDPDSKQAVCLSECKQHSDDSNRPLWFVYSGMGSQWAGMGTQLMRIPIFSAAIHRCHKVLEPLGIDILHIITSTDPHIFDNILNSFVGIAAIQIGITDILNELDLQPTYIIGHSVGELGCAYADGCLTAEEMILSAYSRGKASNTAKLIRGAMAAVGMGYQQLSKLCPPSIEIACHNSASSSTISGPEQAVREFVAMLTSNGIFAKEVPCANIAYHSRYIVDAGSHLRKLLSDIIKEPKLRSERWVSTSVPQEKWDEPTSKYCSAEYLTNNLLSPVLFEETSSLIASNAVLVEIALHGLLQAILKRALPVSCTNIPLTKRGHDDSVVFLLKAIGQIYVEGFCPQLNVLYPKVEFPVSVTTPLLSHLVQWNHSEAWVNKQRNYKTTKGAAYKVMINVYDNEYCYLAGNVIQGKVLFPFAGVLVAVWDTLAMTLGYPKRLMSVRFHDVHLYTQPIIDDRQQLTLNVSLHRGSGRFEVLDGNSKVATGYSEFVDKPNLGCSNISKEFKIKFSSEEIYKYFESRGYSYSGVFESISGIDESLENAQIVWNDNWVSFIDGLLQLNIIKRTQRGLATPFQIRELTIDVDHLMEVIQKETLNGKITLQAKVSEMYDSTRCGGVILQNLKIHDVPSFNEVFFELSTPTTVIKNINASNKNQNGYENNLSLKIGEFGNIETLHWEESPFKTSGGGIKVLVEYAGINKLDANKASGVIHYEEPDSYFGMDFSGVTESGSRVMGLVRGGAVSSVVWALPELLWPVPPHWTLEEAATVPLAYTQAFYYLCVKNELVRGWSILVHGAAGALGQAAISVALAHGCRVFATVSETSKKRMLLKLFPQLNENDIGNSRDESFGDMILAATNGNGCNIVLSCVKGELKNMSLKCAAFSGITIDLVQIQNRDKFEYGMFNMTKQRSYMAADFHSVMDGGNIEEYKKLQQLVVTGIARGSVRPLTRVTFGPLEAARAVRLLAASQHRGRVLLRLSGPFARITPRITCTSSNVNIIVWDGSTFGIQLADRLIARGAKKLRILNLAPNTGILLKLRLWEKSGVDVKVTSGSSTDADLVLRFINETFSEAHVEGIYINLTESSSYNIDKIIELFDASSRKCKLPLKYFAIIGERVNKQQLCTSRIEEGLPAKFLALPAFKNEEKSLGRRIGEHVWNRSALDITEFALRSKHPVLYAQLKAVNIPSLGKLFPVLAGGDYIDATIDKLILTESIPAIQSFLKNMYHVYLDTSEISSMTKKQLFQIEANANKANIFEKQEKGFETFFSMKEHDELRATTVLLPMDTVLVHVQTSMGGIEIGKPHLFIIPGVEGHYARFNDLCKHLKLSAFVLQTGLNNSEETPKVLATRYSKILLEQFKLNKNFYLLAYEFGIAVALELTAILEDNGLTGTVYCIGDGPVEMKNYLESQLSSFKTETELQEALVRTIYTQMTEHPMSALETALRDCASWEDRVEVCVRSLLGRAPHTAEYLRSLLRAAYGRIDIARRTIPESRALRSQFILLRARNEMNRSGPSSLQRFTARELIMHELASPLAHAAADMQVPAIVNKYLDADVLAQYEKSNLCEPYLYFG